MQRQVISLSSPRTLESNATLIRELLSRLNQVCELLAQVQKAAHYGMQAIELVMKDPDYPKIADTKSDAKIDIS